MIVRQHLVNISFAAALVFLSSPAFARYSPPALSAPVQNSPGVDPLLETSWHLDTIRAPAAWQVTSGSRQTVIAVIDSGINYNHSEVSEAVYRNNRDCNFDNIDDDRNGFTDDCIGWNFNDEVSLPWDDNGHGTFISSIVVGAMNNTLGGIGVCPGCSILPIRAIDADGFMDTEDAIRGIEYAVKMKVKVINLSFAGEGYDQALRNALKAAQENDVVVIAAAGNDGMNNDEQELYPANFQMPNLLTVAATKRDGDLWGKSNYSQKKVHIAAPGTTIWGLWVDEKWYRSQGTSFATPIVAGVAGLVRSANPRLTAVEVVDIIKATATPSRYLEDKIKSGGVVNAEDAVKCAVDPSLSCLKGFKKHSPPV